MGVKDKVVRPIQETAELERQAAALKSELDEVNRLINAFENKIRTAIGNELIEEQELTELYKQLKKAKKDKRLQQKKKGKNYQEPTGIVMSSKPAPATDQNHDEIKELKKLYREAMLHVHPDKFTMDEDNQEAAHETTSQLIRIYQTNDLPALRAFHAHILSGHAISGVRAKDLTKLSIDPHQHLRNELEALKGQLATLKNRHTYKVWTTYNDPYTFIEELREYYQDRIGKLKRRTRLR
ncbi:MAG: hypothetical protein RIC35_01565 [Marinoscillum sp.]